MIVYHLLSSFITKLTLNKGPTQQNKHLPFPEEIKKQLANKEGHWHFFYSEDELFYVISEGYGGSHIHICEENGSTGQALEKTKIGLNTDLDICEIIISRSRNDE
jgi:UDP-N-acetylglucosamine 2-epimerase